MQLRTRTRRLVLASVFVSAVMFATPALAANLYIDANAAAGGNGSAGAPYKTISAAVTASTTDDSLLVAAGTYSESLLVSKRVSILGAGSGVCTIDAQGTGFSAVRFVSGSDGALISGFRITNGVGTTDMNGRMLGGGVFCENASPTIEDCLITGNTSDYGAGIGASSATPVIVGCRIRNNVSGFFGGGLMAMYCSPVVTNCVIDSNTAMNGGGVFYLLSPGAPTITFSTIAFNTGNGVMGAGSTPLIANSVVWGNGDDIGNGATASYSCIEDPDSGIGVVHGAPLFKSQATQDYALTAGSSCIDAADPLASMTTDILGTARPLDGNADSVAALDMGAYEFDAVPPVTSLSPVGAWFAAPVTVELSATDAGGVAGTYYFLGSDTVQLYSNPFIISAEGTTLVSFYSVDLAGGIEETVEVPIGLDFTPPVTTDNAPSTWQSASVLVTLTAEDPLSGVDSTWYALDGGTSAEYDGTAFAVSAEGTTTVTYGSVDMVGNIETTRSAEVRLDLTPPVTTADTAAKYKDGGEISLEATDALSGVDAIFVSLDGAAFEEYVSPIEVTSLGDHTITYYAVDVAGNVEPQSSDDFEVAATDDGLPHTGGELLPLLLAVVCFAGVGVWLRFSGRKTARAGR
ncbi:MAG: hypothetical protein CVT66_08050 [Actinobacteria bacterium HGW-Actinobacteria-6]|nr:MAG: hypothetical protein CVT66_08050 [Actinobacteria bacterium HGW-Actinobacteria-6]